MYVTTTRDKAASHAVQEKSEPASSSRRSKVSDGAKEPALAEQEEALKPVSGLEGYARPRLKSLKVRKITIDKAGKMTAEIEAKVDGANFQKGVAVKTYVVTSNTSRSPWETAELVADTFERGNYLRDTGLDDYALTDKRLEALKSEAHKALSDPRRTSDARDKSRW